MAGKNIAGSIRKVAIGGITFNTAGDANANMPTSGWENTNVPSSGINMRKMVRRSQTIEGLVLLTNADELSQLKIFAESLDNITLAITTAAGDTYRADGTINIESHESEENRTTVHLLPVEDWTPAVGEVS